MLRCKICGYEGKQLHQHLKAVHNLSGKEYRNLYGSEEILQEGFSPPTSQKKDLAQALRTTVSRKKELDSLKALESYSKEVTREKLTKDNYYLNFLGKSKSRSLLKKDPKLFKSIYEHTQVLEDVSKEEHLYKSNYSFVKRVHFIVFYNYELDSVKCKCGKRHSFRKYCRECNEESSHPGQIHSKDTLRKMRLSAIHRIRSAKGQAAPRYNINSISIIDTIGEKNGYTFQHAENGGEYYIKELGYWLDAYDTEKNVVLEIYEKHHFKKGKISERDIRREEEIKGFLSKINKTPCTFLKYSYEKQQFI